MKKQDLQIESKINLEIIKQRIKNTCARINRNPSEIKLVIVSKTQNMQTICSYIEYNHYSFGENRLQETQQKWPQIKSKYSNIDLHFIGSIQSRKTNKILDMFNVIHSIDEENILKKIANYRLNINKPLPELLMQINIGEETQKRGIKPQDAISFLKMSKEKYNLDIKGAMGIAPINKNPSQFFILLKTFCNNNNLLNISMGMSQDFEKAIEYGSTIVRIGKAIFGEKIEKQ